MKINKLIDLRVDTLCPQSEAMLSSVAKIEVGDDVLGDCKETTELEAYAADLLEMGDALFVSSGTMGNLIALLVHVPRGGEIICGKSSHIYNYELAGASTLGGIAFHPVDDSSGIPSVGDVEGAIREDQIYHARSALICLENTHNLNGGLAATPEEISEIAELAKKHSLLVHIDGARIFAACAALGVNVRDYTQYTDSIMFSLSKGLGAPMGAMLCGSKAFIAEARRTRKMLGGGLRQAGYMAAMAHIGLRDGRANLEQDVRNARHLAEALSTNPNFSVTVNERLSNMVYIWLADENTDASKLVPRLEEAGIRMFGNSRGFRAVFHNGVSESGLPHIISALEKLF